MTKIETPTAEPFTPCEVCGRPTWYAPNADLFVHADGSDNRTCWAARDFDPYGGVTPEGKAWALAQLAAEVTQ